MKLRGVKRWRLGVEGDELREEIIFVAYVFTYGSAKYGILKMSYGPGTYFAFEIQYVILILVSFFNFLHTVYSYGLWFMVSQEEAMDQS